MADVTLPALGESVTEGIITRWFKAVGDPVERDEPLYEVSTDKVDSEMPSPAAGVLAEILVPEGDTVLVGATLAIIQDGASASVPAQPPTEIAAPAPEPAPEPVAPPAAASAPTPAAPPAVPSSSGTPMVTSPVVRRILDEAGIDPSSVTGTGRGGRITRKDADAAVRASGAHRSNGSVPPTPSAAPSPSPTPSTASRVPAPGAPAGASGSAFAFVAIEADYDAVVRALGTPGSAVDGASPDVTVAALRAAIEALGEFPELNAGASADTGEAPQRNVGIAVTLDDGIVVPVIHDAQELTVSGLLRRIREVTARVQARELSVEDLMGGTFTVFPSPATEVTMSIPVVPDSQVATLSLGAVARRATVTSTADGTDALAIRWIGSLGLAFDPGVVHATRAAQFLVRMGELLAVQDWAAEL